jgi:hypothetical protein
MSSLYIKELMRGVEQAGAAAEAKPSSLRQRLEAWHSSLPLASRNRPFAMVELEQATGVAGRFLSATLIQAGWTRKRRWQGTAHYYRFWLPPTGVAAQARLQALAPMDR